MKKQYGKNSKKEGQTPAIVLWNPKYARNVGTVVRAASCFGAKQVWYTGNRVALDLKGKRLPREERMRGYAEVELRQFEYPFEHFDKDVTPVAIELRPNSEPLTNFEHPDNPVYVFGPEDGHLSQIAMRHCHRFVVIPTRHCLNLAAAVNIVLYDRLMKTSGADELTIYDTLAEARAWTEDEENVHEALGLR